MLPKLDQWFITDNDLIIGRIYNHPEFPDGSIIRTSRVAKLDIKNGKAYTAQENYELGEPVDVKSE